MKKVNKTSPTCLKASKYSMKTKKGNDQLYCNLNH